MSIVSRLRRIESRVEDAGGPALLETPEIVAFNSVLSEADRRTLLDLHETGGPYEDEATALSRATPEQLAAHRRFDALRALPLGELRARSEAMGDTNELG